MNHSFISAGVLLRAAFATGVLLVSAFPTTAHRALGASFTVNTTGDAHDALPGDGVCAALDGSCTLRAAVEESNALPGPDAVSVPSGTYRYSVTFIDSDTTYIAGISVDDDLTLSGSSAADTIIDPTQAPGLTLGGRGGSERASLNLTDITIRDSHRGTALNINDVGSFTASRIALIDNAGGAGAIYAAGRATISDSTISGNTGDRAAAIIVRGNLVVSNSTISGNTAYAPAIQIDYGTAQLTNVTVVNNTGGAAGSFEPVGVQAVNSIFANNGRADCLNSLGHNLISNPSDTCHTLTASDVVADPNLGPLAHNGGPTETHALLPGSPAIDAGDDGACPGTDQRGEPRPQDGNADGIAVCDIGAYEAEPPPPPTPEPTAAPTAESQPLAPTIQPLTQSATVAPTATRSPSPSATSSPAKSLHADRTTWPSTTPIVRQDESGGGNEIIYAAAVAIGLSMVVGPGLFVYTRKRGFKWPWVS